VHVEPIDPGDDAAFGRWFAVTAVSRARRWPDQPGWQPEELRAPALDPDGAGGAVVLLGAFDGGEVVGAAQLELPEHDNRHLVELTVEVHPAARRRGVGRALVAGAEQVARDRGRRSVWGREELPSSDGAEPPGSRAFAQRLGYALAQVAILRHLRVPAAPSHLDRLEADCRAHAEGYRLVTWRDRVPDELLEDRLELLRRMSTDAPAGELALEQERWDERRLRRGEDLRTAQGRTMLCAGAVHEATGRMVADTVILVPTGAPEMAFQWDTLVLPAHRGHRLGTLVKVENLRQLQAVSPSTRLVGTSNAQDNGPMIAVNEALGAHVAGTELNWQKHLA